MAAEKGDHWADAVRYVGVGRVPSPSTADMVKAHQSKFDAIMAAQAKKIQYDADKSIIDALQQYSGITDVMVGSAPKRNVGPNAYFVTNGVDPIAMLASRLRLPFISGVDKCYWFNPLDHVSILFDEHKAFIMVVANGKASVLEDDAKNFPTDELVAQFRILLASQ